MNDNYLWDKSGEPDEEIQHLEMLLSDFRYQPRPLVLPEATPKRMIFSQVNLATIRYAAIAAVALLALGLGLWFGLRPANKQQQIVIQQPQASPVPSVEQKPETPPEVQPQEEAPQPQTAKQFAPSQHRAMKAHKRMVDKQAELEGELAKEKVLYALQITSEKLNLISKKIQTDTN